LWASAYKPSFLKSRRIAAGGVGFVVDAVALNSVMTPN
jgi:hypothetical protein